MLLDAMFFGMPLVISGCLAVHAVRDEEPKFWIPAFAMFCYCIFYLGGGREVMLYLGVALLAAGGMLNSGGLIAGQ